MGITQIGVFVENQPGHVNRLTSILDKAGVSIRGFSLADTADFGIARFVLDEPEIALTALGEAGVLMKTTELLCIELPDTPGALNHVFAVLAGAGINVEYAYSLVSTFVALKVNDIKQAEQVLSQQSLRFIEQDALRRPLARD